MSQATVFPYNITDYCFGFPYPSHAGMYNAVGFTHKLSFDKPVKNIKVLVHAMDGNLTGPPGGENISISTNSGKTPILTAFPDTSGWNVAFPL